jgi:hypothetical protein
METSSQTDRRTLRRARQAAALRCAPPSRADVQSGLGTGGVQLAGNWSEGGVLASYERLRRKFSAVLGDRLPLVLYARRGAGSTHVVRVSEKTRSEADALCAKLRAVGGACIVKRNPRD